MEFGAYLCFSVMVWILGLTFVARARQRVGAYAALSLSFVLGGLILFYLLSIWAGIVRLGVVQDWSLPQDYVAHGALGIVIMLVGVAGLVSPAIAAWIVSRQKVAATRAMRKEAQTG